jgi:hypothetical protein
MLATVLVFGMTVVGCEDDKTNGNGNEKVETSIEGTWVATGKVALPRYNHAINEFMFQEIEGEIEIKLNNGIYEYAGFYTTPSLRGTYYISDNNITINTTHVLHSHLLDLLIYNISNAWYTVEQMETMLRQAIDERWNNKPNETTISNIVTQLRGMYGTQTGTYVLNGNNLTITMNGETITYTRR